MDWLTQLISSHNETLDMKNWQVALLLIVVGGAAAFVLFGKM